MDAWQTLHTELDAWAACGEIADLWWRDDDAVATGPKLDQLLAVTATTGLLLAVIPVNAEQELAHAVKAAPHVKVAQHGYAHINHAEKGQGQGAWELGLHRGEQVVLDELDLGRKRLEALFDDNFIPVIVPPWNHIDAALLAPVAARGYRGVSGFGPRDDTGHNSSLSHSFTIVNSHCDLIRWKTGAKFKGATKTINQLVAHLQARRMQSVDASEPTGYLTHHIDMDREAWEFSEQLVESINTHQAARWCTNLMSVFGGKS